MSMNSPRRILIAAAALAALLCTARAVPITGGISLAGGYTVNTGNLNTATAFTSFTEEIVTSRSGSFVTAGVAIGAAAVVNPFSFIPFVAPVPNLWSIPSVPGTTFSLNQLTLVEQLGDDTLELRGLGILTLPGFDPTAGSWLFTANQAGVPLTFSWSSSNAAIAQVPEGGTTAALLGLSLLAIGVAARRTRKV
jgi:hypothetical protein